MLKTTDKRIREVEVVLKFKKPLQEDEIWTLAESFNVLEPDMEVGVATNNLAISLYLKPSEVNKILKILET